MPKLDRAAQIRAAIRRAEKQESEVTSTPEPGR